MTYWVSLRVVHKRPLMEVAKDFVTNFSIKKCDEVVQNFVTSFMNDPFNVFLFLSNISCIDTIEKLLLCPKNKQDRSHFFDEQLKCSKV